MPQRILSIPVQTHGRVLVEDAADSPAGLLVGFHGYGQSADEMLAELRRLPGAGRFTLVAPQALHRFYARDNRTVVASWMTRQDRDEAIADNVAYVDRLVGDLRGAGGTARIVYAGFSQGVAMAYRAALLGQHEPAGVVAVGGDIPPELKVPGAARRAWPPVLAATGTGDTWYTPARLGEDQAFLASTGAPHTVVTFEGGHEWTDEVRQVTGMWLTNVVNE